MLKTYAAALTAYIPTHQLNKLLQTWTVRFAAALPTLLQATPSFGPLSTVLLQKQLTSTAARLKLLRIPTVLLLLIFFLVLGPHTSVLANWEEKVVPDKRTFATSRIAEKVTAQEVPKFSMPVQTSYISTYFSRLHQGVDLPNPYGSPIRSIAEGSVVFAGFSNLGYGNMIVVRHSLGYESLYAHLSGISVQEGDSVGTNSVIGTVGATGLASGNHLHLEVHLPSTPPNPFPLLQ